MDKEEILERSRKENRDRDFVEAEALAKANAIALSVGIIVCGLLTIFRAIFAGTPDFGIWTVYFSVLAATMIVKFVKLRRRHELAVGLLYLGFCVFFLVIYLRELLWVT